MDSLIKNFSLDKSNYILCGVHLLAGLVLLAYALYKRDKKFTFELYAGSKQYAVSSRVLVYAAVAFLLITSCFHLYYALDFGKRYSVSVMKGKQSIRWLEYGITATIMAIIIAAISGVKDIYTLATLGALSVGIMSTGLWFENIFGVESRWTTLIPLLVGFGLLVVYSGIVYFNFRDERKKYDLENSEPLPKWISWIVLGTLAFFSCFGFVPLIKYFGFGKPLYYEYAYLILSAIAKLYLGFFLGYGLLKRDQ